jgi:predicted nucleic acid-binding protein
MVLYLDICRLKRPFDDQAQPRRTTELIANGMRGFDALHLACAEAAAVDVFVTCDDRLLAVAQRLGPAVKVRVGELTTVAREVL